MLCVVAAPGPSLSLEIGEQLIGHHVIAVNDAYRRVPAKAIYGADWEWWVQRQGVPGFEGERWTCIYRKCAPQLIAARKNISSKYGINLIEAKIGNGFTLEPPIHFGRNSGFQAVNLAIVHGFTRIVLVGFDMQGSHFFGEHKPPLRNKQSYIVWRQHFVDAAKRLPAHITIINATPDSALSCFPMMTLAEALSESREARPQDSH